MKRVAFFQDNLDVGGIQKSLVNLLRNFDYEHFQVDLYLSDRRSFWKVDFPPQLNIKYLKHIPRICSFIPFDVARTMVSLDFGDCGEYDLAVDFNSYQFSCALGALTVPAKRRVMWIHNNVSVKLENEWKYRVLWRNFKDKFKYYDGFVGVSQGVIEPFMASAGIFDPAKFTVIQNTIDTEEIYTKAREASDFTPDPNKMNFVAIGRLCHQKGYDIMLDVFARASRQRDDLHLYIIGDGDKRFFLEYQRDSLGLTDKVTFLGQQTNPFRYMEKMDAFVSTSRYEGQGMNIMEARSLGLPLYCTRNLEKYNEGLTGYDDLPPWSLPAASRKSGMICMNTMRRSSAASSSWQSPQRKPPPEKRPSTSLPCTWVWGAWRRPSSAWQTSLPSAMRSTFSACIICPALLPSRWTAGCAYCTCCGIFPTGKSGRLPSGACGRFVLCGRVSAA